MTAERSQKVCRTLNYHGRVQGVGFRYTTNSIARRFQVVGYVKNLADGSVELVVAGDASEVAAFLTDVSATFGDQIESVSTTETAAPEQYVRFEIRR